MCIMASWGSCLDYPQTEGDHINNRGRKNGPRGKKGLYLREPCLGRLFIICVLAPYMPSAASIRVSVRVG